MECGVQDAFLRALGWIVLPGMGVEERSRTALYLYHLVPLLQPLKPQQCAYLAYFCADRFANLMEIWSTWTCARAKTPNENAARQNKGPIAKKGFVS